MLFCRASSRRLLERSWFRRSFCFGVIMAVASSRSCRPKALVAFGLLSDLLNHESERRELMTNGMHPHDKGRERNQKTAERPPEKPTDRKLDSEAPKDDGDKQSSK